MADWARAQSPGAVDEILDQENKRMADHLASKVTRLKSLALDIDRDAEDQNRYLDSMREAVLYNGAVWAGQPAASVRCGLGPARGLLHPLLPPVEGEDVRSGLGAFPQDTPLCTTVSQQPFFCEARQLVCMWKGPSSWVLEAAPSLL
ncbi:BET1-like protein isoform 1-T1 [Dugong dugon]